MRKRISRGRGRPRGKHYSPADFKLLQYLAVLSIKYDVDADEFFDSFFKAWKHQQSKCKSLSIKCRKTTLDDAVFLITQGFNVVAQFSMSTRILEEPNPLKEFVRSRASDRTIAEKREVRDFRIGDLKSGMNRITLKARVVEIPSPRSVITKFGGFSTVTNARIKDETGIIQLPLWNQQIDTVSAGDLIRVENGRVVTFRGQRQLRVGRSGQLTVIEKQ